MADDIDSAQEVNELHQELSLIAARAKAQPEQHDKFDGKHCVDCEEPIPPVRLALGRVRCVDCQSIIEFHNKMHAR